MGDSQPIAGPLEGFFELKAVYSLNEVKNIAVILVWVGMVNPEPALLRVVSSDGEAAARVAGNVVDAVLVVSELGVGKQVRNEVINLPLEQAFHFFFALIAAHLKSPSPLGSSVASRPLWKPSSGLY